MSSWEEFIQKLEAELSEFHHTVEDYSNMIWNSLTENGTLTMPGHAIFQSHTAPAPQMITKPPPSTIWQRMTGAFGRRPWLYSALFAGVPLAAYLAVNHSQLVQLTALQRRYLDRPQRPLTNKGTIRLEACLIIGADLGSVGESLAMDLVSRGFVVIAVVSDAHLITELQRRGKGYLKAIALNDQDTESISACIQSLSTALSLRYPLNSAGDPFQSGRAMALSAVINCLALTKIHSSIPLEATSPQDFARNQIARLAPTLALLQGALPMMRNTNNTVLSAHPAIVLTLVPTASNRIALPFTAGASVFDAALITLMNSMRREVQCANVGQPTNLRRKISFVNLEVGYFEAANTQEGQPNAGLPRHLQFYSAAVLRRSGQTSRRRAAPVSRLCEKVYKTIIHSSGRRSTSIGPGVFTYKLMSWLPTSLVDTYFSAQDYVATTLRTQPVRRPLPSPLPQTSSADAQSRASVASIDSPPASSSSDHSHHDRGDMGSLMTSSVSSLSSASSEHIESHQQHLGASSWQFEDASSAAPV